MTEQEKKQYLIDFGKRVKFYREKIGMTQKELGVKAGYVDGTNPSAAISKIEHGQMDIGQAKTAEIAEALGIEVYDLIVSQQISRLVKYAEGIMNLEKGADHVES